MTTGNNLKGPQLLRLRRGGPGPGEGSDNNSRVWPVIAVRRGELLVETNVEFATHPLILNISLSHTCRYASGG